MREQPGGGQITLDGQHHVAARATRASGLGAATLELAFPGALWLLLWAGINTGPWRFRTSPDSLLDWVHVVRAAIPALVLTLAVVATPQRRRVQRLPGALRLWVAYGCLGVLSAVLSPVPLDALYWGAAYLAPFAVLVLWVTRGDPVARADRLVQLTWIVTTIVVLALCVVARDLLVQAPQTEWSTYDVFRSTGNRVGGMPMSRSSGMARFAAVPAITAYVMLWRSRGLWRRLLWISLLLAAVLVVVLMQSRGAVVALLLALAFTTYALGRATRIVALVAVIAGAFVVLFGGAAGESLEAFATHLARGEALPRLRTMTGRVAIWTDAWDVIMDSPILGYGFRADRFHGLGHVHNTYLYVLLTAGLMGLIVFVAGLVGAWRAAVGVLRLPRADRCDHVATTAQSIGVLTFFSVRSIPEVSGALFGVDLMVMLPAMAYLALVHKSARQRRAAARRWGRAPGSGPAHG